MRTALIVLQHFIKVNQKRNQKTEKNDSRRTLFFVTLLPFSPKRRKTVSIADRIHLYPCCAERAVLLLPGIILRKIRLGEQ